MMGSKVLVACITLSASLLAGEASAQPPRACCSITAIDARANVISARESATGNAFEFTARNRALLSQIRVGQAVHANFATQRVSLDGRTVCCTITKAPAPSVAPRPAAVPAPTRGPTTAAPPAPPTPGGAAAPLQTAVPRAATSLPQVTYGAPMAAPPAHASGGLTRVATRSASARVKGRNVTSQLLHLNGRQGIRNSGLPDGVRRLLEMHVRKVPLAESQYYIVHPQLAAQWAATHPVPPEVKPKDANEDNSDCGTISINGIVDCTEDAAQAIEDEFERARKRAEDWWDESTGDLADQWSEAKSCFADHTLPGPETPVKFSITPSMTVNMEQSGSRGSAQGTLKGSVTLGVPMQSDFLARMEFFYIPCLPFVFRPKRITADGSLTVGQQLGVDLTATGAFDKIFTVPPTGGPQIVLYVIPIVIGDIPVAVLDVSAYIEGEIQVKGDGRANGSFAVTNAHRSSFDFACSGKGCSGVQKGTTVPTTTNESAQVQGQVSVQPGIYTALQLSFDYNVLQARAGPQPYLLGVANGCGAISGSQSTNGSSTSATNAALTADLDWGLKLRAEALAGGQRIGDRWESKAMQDRHLWYRDMAPGGSTALVATVTGPAQATASQPASVNVRMPSCYPYKDDVQYRITWSGGAIPAPHPACQWQGATGTCRFDPASDLAIKLTWQNPGVHTLSVQPLRDAHRAFNPAPRAATLTVTISAAPGGGDGTP